MYKITQKYEDYNGVEKEEDFYFNLTKADLLKMELSEEGGMDKRLDKLIKTNNMKEAIKVFEGLLLLSFGIKTDDGRFVRSDEAREKFISSAAYPEIYFRLATDVDEANNFVAGIVPKIEGSSIPAPEITQRH